MKRLTMEERTRRVLIAAYNRILDEGCLPDDLGLLDAMKDCFTGDKDLAQEWTVSKHGEIRFK